MPIREQLTETALHLARALVCAAAAGMFVLAIVAWAAR
jgi:hypothetical protein